ncbi:hypothetical protein St703_04900 [Sporolactobacillus terrae]|uniref:Uncharacterized protein n=1 Tax=Sporolactobacillus terrae TaxID=269673 RepID=A0A5K7WTG1_9BACL|nr:hypothetical protein St703_04900 [Sporolactobacillus terrae]
MIFRIIKSEKSDPFEKDKVVNNRDLYGPANFKSYRRKTFHGQISAGGSKKNSAANKPSD